MLIKNLLKVSAISALLFSSYSIADQATLMKAGCAGCHQLAVKTVGPAIKDIAKQRSSADIDTLVKLVQSGKDGKTPGQEFKYGGTIPMPASTASEADIRKVITWMLQQ